MKGTTLKILGMVTSVAGVLVSLASDWIAEKEISELVQDEVRRAINEFKEEQR